MAGINMRAGLGWAAIKRKSSRWASSGLSSALQAKMLCGSGRKRMATLPLGEDDRAIFLEQKELGFWAQANLYTALLNAWKI
jgi:hypothetical protein